MEKQIRVVLLTIVLRYEISNIDKAYFGEIRLFFCKIKWDNIAEHISKKLKPEQDFSIQIPKLGKT